MSETVYSHGLMREKFIQRDLDRAQNRLDEVTGNVQDETDEKEAE